MLRLNGAWALVVLGASMADGQWNVDPRAALDAITIGQSALQGDRARFHQPYHLVVSRAPLDAVDIVTPFRRIVIAAELRARAGDRRFGQREALEVAARYPQQLSVHAELTFHPQNVLVLVPTYTMTWVTTRGERIESMATVATPRYSPRTAGDALPGELGEPGTAGPPSLPSRGAPMLGATVVATFDGPALGRADDPVRELVIAEAGREELARLAIDLSKLR